MFLVLKLLILCTRSGDLLRVKFSISLENWSQPHLQESTELTFHFLK